MRKTRNQTPFWYCLYDRPVPIIDQYGNESGEPIVLYEEANRMYANVSPATGQSNTEQFGNLDNYDKVIVTSEMNCPIDENAVLFIGKEPEYTTVTTWDFTPSVPAEVSYSVPAFNYTVRRVAKSINSISIAVKKVDVS